MAQNLYMRDDVREKLDQLAKLDKRPLIDEINFLCDRRLTELTIPETENAVHDISNHTPEAE